MLPFPDCPLKQQLGLEQVRVDCLLRFIRVCCQKTIRKSSWNHVLRGCWTVGESQQHFPEEAPLLRAFAIQDRLEQNPDLTLQRIAEAAGVSPSYVTRLLRLSYLAPDIVTAVVDGQQPPELTAEKLMRNTRLPLSWEAQRKRLGFAPA